LTDGLTHLFVCDVQPKQVAEVKNFLRLTKRKDAKWVKARKSAGKTKFKVRTSKYLFTLITSKKSAIKLKGALPPAIQKRGVFLAGKKGKAEAKKE
jgi:large subunit ribosomal protein L38e